MNREEFKAMIDSVAAMEDQTDRLSALSEIADTADFLFTMNEQLTTTSEKLKADLVKSQNYAMDLWLRRKDEKPAEQQEQQPEQETLTYDKLFNDKGELK